MCVRLREERTSPYTKQLMGIWTETITGGSWATTYVVSQAGTAITQIGWRMPMRFRTE